MTPYPLDIPSDVELQRDVQYGQADGVELRLDLARPKARGDGERLPAIIYIHGGAWQSGSKEDGVPAICYYAQNGFAAASVGYRLSGVAKFPAQIEDCKCAVRFLRAKADEYGIDPERIGAMGVSSGAHQAALVGLSGNGDQFANKGGWETYSSEVSAVCDLSGPTDLLWSPGTNLSGSGNARALLLGGTIDEVRGQYVKASPVKHVHKDAPPFLIVHGELDMVVPLRHGEILSDALRMAGVDVQFHIVKRAGHASSEVVTPEVRVRILAFFEKWLKRK